ncbi:MAG: 2'-5' RNA ligase family protein [Bacteroidales bacterium]
MEQLFFLGIIPPPAIFSEIETFKTYAAKNFNSKHALRSPSHVTVLSPFYLKSEKKEDACLYLKKFFQEINSFNIQLKNFNHFGERVVYIQITNHKELKELHEDLKKDFYSQAFIDSVPIQKYPYNPHLTIAFKDLKSYYFAKAERYYMKLKYLRNFTVEKIHLFNYRNSRWFKIDEFQLNKKHTFFNQ